MVGLPDERFEQLGCAVTVGIHVGGVLDQRMGGPPDLPPLLGEEDIAVTAKPRIAGPFVASYNFV